MPDDELERKIYELYGINEQAAPQPEPRKRRGWRKIVYTAIILLLVFGSLGSSIEPIMNAINYQSRRRQLNDVTITQATGKINNYGRPVNLDQQAIVMACMLATMMS